MGTEDGPLVAADEWFGHQIVETHAYVAPADRSWTEKVCAMAGARDGSLSIGFGVGKYTNRNVFDAYAGVSRGTEQWTVRGSRRLADDLETLGAGPVRYEVLEPMRRVRLVCEANDVQPIAFDCEFTAVVDPVLELRHREVQRAAEDTAVLRVEPQIGRHGAELLHVPVGVLDATLEVALLVAGRGRVPKEVMNGVPAPVRALEQHRAPREAEVDASGEPARRLDIGGRVTHVVAHAP